MIEVAFSESLAGALKYAIGRKRGDAFEQGAVFVFCDDLAVEKQLRAEVQKPQTWQGGEIPGTPANVACLNLLLDMGDISAPENRLPLLRKLYGCYEGVPEEMQRTTDMSLAALDTADEIRLWVGEQDASDIIGAFYICNRYRNAPKELHVVYVPMFTQCEDSFTRNSGAADSTPEQISLHVHHSALLTDDIRAYMADRFTFLQSENAPLRAMVNGIVASVPETLYDPILLSCLPEGEFVLGKWLGKALLQTRGVGDAYLYLRIQNMLREGTLCLCKPAREDNPYSAILKRANS